LISQTYNLQEVERRGRVEVPVQLVQDGSLHAEDLSGGEVAAAALHQVLNGADHLSPPGPPQTDE